MSDRASNQNTFIRIPPPALILGGQTFVNVVKVINIGQKFNLLKRTGGKIWQTIFPCKNVG